MSAGVLIVWVLVLIIMDKIMNRILDLLQYRIEHPRRVDRNRRYYD